MDELIYPAYVDEYSSQEEDQGIEFWERDTVNYFLNRTEQEFPYRVYAMFRTLLYTGIRKGELGALLESDVCKKKELQISKNLIWINEEYLLLRPKTKNSVRTMVKLKKLNKQLREDRGNPEIEKFFPASKRSETNTARASERATSFRL